MADAAVVSMRHVEGSLFGFGRTGLWVLNVVELLDRVGESCRVSRGEWAKRREQRESQGYDDLATAGRPRTTQRKGGDLGIGRRGSAEPGIAGNSV